jgi:plasminogen activator inhibitor 1 RNA-binding protein
MCVAPSRKAHHGQDAHTKGPRGSRPARGGDRTQGGSKTPAQGGERRQFERRSGAYEDSQKKVEAGWGADEGKAELSGESEGTMFGAALMET